MKSHLMALFVVAFVISVVSLIAMYPIPALILALFVWVVVLIGGTYWYTYKFINAFLDGRKK